MPPGASLYPKDPTMNHRAYTVPEIDSMRKSVMALHPQDGWAGAYCNEVEQMRALYAQSTEARLRTYMEAGVGPEELADAAAKTVAERARVHDEWLKSPNGQVSILMRGTGLL